jgi:hypothetical protein
MLIVTLTGCAARKLARAAAIRWVNPHNHSVWHIDQPPTLQFYVFPLALVGRYRFARAAARSGLPQP